MLKLSRIRKAFLPDGKTVDRALSQSEIMCNELKSKFSALGFFKKPETTEQLLYDMWEQAEAGSVNDYRAGKSNFKDKIHIFQLKGIYLKY